ncbi:MAG: thiol peroxidase [Elusimicrobiales bacterium]|nr:thiol peroxidase [Elusimicrobiales bacterium]
MEEEIQEQEETITAVKRTVTMQGRPMTLAGDEIKVGDKAPDFKTLDNDMMPMKFLRSNLGKVSVILSVPSLDTPVCDLETRRFNKEAQSLSPDINILAISMDLPFAQKRWCGAAGVTNVKTYSDYQKGAFGRTYGVLMKDLRLLARAIFVIDREGVITYTQLVKEVTNEPNYDEVLNEIKKLN